jgi:hypothetical protein
MLEDLELHLALTEGWTRQHQICLAQATDRSRTQVLQDLEHKTMPGMQILSIILEVLLILDLVLGNVALVMTINDELVVRST